MRGASVAAVLLGLWIVLGSPSVSRAQENPSRIDMSERQTNEAGFTLGDFVKLNLREMIKHPLSPENLSQVSDDVHKAPHRGVQFELLTPGDFGATIHFRW